MMPKETINHEAARVDREGEDEFYTNELHWFAVLECPPCRLTRHSQIAYLASACAPRHTQGQDTSHD
jgi:hypothetical protein